MSVRGVPSVKRKVVAVDRLGTEATGIPEARSPQRGISPLGGDSHHRYQPGRRQGKKTDVPLPRPFSPPAAIGQREISHHHRKRDPEREERDSDWKWPWILLRMTQIAIEPANMPAIPHRALSSISIGYPAFSHFESSCFAMLSICTSSGPSARRRVRQLAQAPARKVSWQTPAAPWA
jgi:hypothetical protein